MTVAQSDTAAQVPEQEAADSFGKPPEGWRRGLYSIVFEADTRAARTFDILLVFVIVPSILVVVLASVPAVNSTKWGQQWFAPFKLHFFSVIRLTFISGEVAAAFGRQ